MFVNVSWVLKNIHVQTATVLTGKKLRSLSTDGVHA